MTASLLLPAPRRQKELSPGLSSPELLFRWPVSPLGQDPFDTPGGIAPVARGMFLSDPT